MARHGALHRASDLGEDGREVGVDSRLLPVEADVADRVLLLMLELARGRLHGGPAVFHLFVLGVRAAVEYLAGIRKLILTFLTKAPKISYGCRVQLQGISKRWTLGCVK